MSKSLTLKPIKYSSFYKNARACELKLNTSLLRTPIFMPVGTQASVKSLSSLDISELSYDLILSNTYHLYLRPGIDVLDEVGGVKKFMNHKGVLLTDSGGFQVFSLSSLFKFKENGVSFKSHIDGSNHEFTPQKVIDIQKIFRSDIMMVLDDCAPASADLPRLTKSVQRTYSWAKMSIEYWHDNFNNIQNLFGIVQGGINLDLRLESLEQISSLPFDGIAIGGLSVGESKTDMYLVLHKLSSFLDKSRPVYLMGVGEILDILEAVKNGVDMFDCVLPTRNARNGQFLTSKGKLNIRNTKFKKDFNPIDTACECKICKNYTLSYLHHLNKAKELSFYSFATYHNLYFMNDFFKQMQTSIIKDKFEVFYEKWKGIYSK